jgi:hypothetical protein
MRGLSILLVVGLSFLGLAACGDDPPPSTSGTAGSGGMGGGGTAGGGTAGSGGGMGGGSNAGYCGKSCAMPKDCCPMGAMNCPGAYPNNWTCDSGACGAPQCGSDADCTFGGVLMDYKCLTVSGNKVCVESCAADMDCTPGTMTTCTGTDDAGMKYCTTMAAGGCTDDASCMGYGKCNTTSKACECTADADCTGTGVDKCVQ